MKIPHEQLAPDTLRAIVEEFVSRNGTDYGAHEVSFESKVNDVLRQLERGKAQLLFDAESESVDIRES